MDLFNFFSSPTAQATPIKEDDDINILSDNRPRRRSPTMPVSSASSSHSSRQLGPLFARMHDVFEKKIAADLRTPESVKSITGRSRTSSINGNNMFSPMSCSPMVIEDSGRKTVFSALRSKMDVNTDTMIETTKLPPSASSSAAASAASKASQYALFLKKNPPLVVPGAVIDTGKISPRSVGSDEGSTCWGSIGSNELTSVLPTTTLSTISPNKDHNIHVQKPTLVAFTNPVISSIQNIASPSSIDFSIDSDSSPRSINSTTSEDSTGSLLSMNTLRNTAINAMTSGAPSQHIVYPNGHHPSSSSSSSSSVSSLFVATSSSTVVNSLSTMTTTPNNMAIPSTESGLRWESQLNALFDAAAGGVDGGLMGNPIDLAKRGGIHSPLMSHSPLVSPLASPERLTSPSSRSQQQQHDDLRNESNENHGASESLIPCNHWLIDHQTTTIGGNDDDVGVDDFHHCHQLPTQTTAPSSSIALPPTSHGSMASIRTNPPNCTDATTTTSTITSNSKEAAITSTSNNCSTTVLGNTIDMGGSASRRRKKSNASKSFDFLPLGLTVVLVVCILGIFLFSLKYIKFLYGWTLYKDDVVGRIKHDTTSNNNIHGFVGSPIGIIGGILKGVLKNVVLNDSFTPSMTPLRPENEDIQPRQDTSHPPHHHPFVLVRQWIQHALIRLDEHKNRHKVAKNLSATPILLDNFANSGQQGAFDPLVLQSHFSKIKGWITRCWNQRHGAGCQW